MKTDTYTTAASPLDSVSSEKISPEKWPAFCKAFTQQSHGILVSVERRDEDTGSETVAEAHGLAFEELSSHILKNGVAAVTVVMEGKPRKIRLDMTGPTELRGYRNPQGWPVRLEISSASGARILHFAGEMRTSRGASANSWGE